jgi:TetR/AcrR family transcriptional regulator, regulator of cefoperazone and chloramphenicol sensitivity
MSAAAVESPLDTKQRLLRAGEQLFARDGIYRARIRDINALAGQRNSSALHYHFGSRDGLANAIMFGHQAEIDAAVEIGLDKLEARGEEPSAREVLGAVIPSMAARLRTDSGRDWALIVPQMMPMVSENLRHGVLKPGTPQSNRVLRLLRPALRDLPETLQRERLVDYSIALTALLAERAHQLSCDHTPVLSDDEFTSNLIDMLTALLCAPRSDLKPRS